MASLNKVSLIGFLGKDVELRYTADGKSVANFSMATSESWKDKQDQWQSITEWHSVTVWEPLAERIADIPKGAMVYVEGKIKTNEYTGKDGITRRQINIVASRVFDLRPKDQKGEKRQETKKEQDPPLGDNDFIPEIEEDDVPL